MNTTCKKSIALLLVLLQLVVLLPFSTVNTQAAGTLPASTAAAAGASGTPQPKLNMVYTGTVQFGTFNYTSETGSKEAADYVMPYIYTDDYFASSAIDVNPSAKELPWTALENKSLATTSMDFTMACYGSNEEITNEADYDTDYDKNGKEFLAACDFKNIESNNYDYDGSDPLTKENKYNKFPSKDSVGTIIGSKEIEVWNGTENEKFTLVAIGVRGAGYGAEWASNLTLGVSGEHQGFREGANKVEYMLDDYMNRHGITASDNVKFWVCGYSRAGAIANLVAGDLSTNSKYNVAKANVYGYTFESAAGADMSVDPNGTQFPNIHNILNKMDAVPRVSADFFGNNRYGVDYIVPNYKNVNGDTNLRDSYYNRMYRILETVATGYFDESGSPEQDPVLTSGKPSTLSGSYPVDGLIQVHQFEIKSATNGSFGAVPYTGRWGNQPNGTDIGTKSGSNYYIHIDDYLDSLVTMMFASKAWDYNPRNATANITNTNPMTHRQKFATKQNGQTESYQDAMRDLVGIALGTPGAKLTDLFDDIAGTLFSNLLDAAQLLLSITGNRLPWISNGYDDHPDDSHAETVSGHMKDLLYGVLKDKYPFSENRSATQTAIDTLSPVLTRLFLYDRSGYGSQYLGTLLKYALNTILVTHTPELDVSWQMAMDENYVNSYREIVLPGTADVKMYVFRAGFEDALPTGDDAAAAAAQGALVAEVKGGSLQDGCLDMRISAKPNADGTVTLRYPGTEDYRFDIEGGATGLQVTDLQPVRDVNVKAAFGRDSVSGNIIPDSRILSDEGLLEVRNGASAQALNARTDLAVAEGETLCVMAWHGTNSLDKTQTENTYSAVKAYTVTFDANKGDGSMEPMKNAVSGAMLTENAFTRDAYDFDGWNTEADGSGTAYADGAALDGLNSSLKLYAQWKVQTYTVDLYFRAPGVADKLGGTVKDYAATKSMKLTATPTYTNGDKHFYFDHWEFGVDEQTTLQYPYRIVTIRPSQGGHFKAYAVYSETKKTDFTPFVMIIRDEEVGGKLVKTLTYSLPDGYTLKAGSVGFRVYDEDGQVIGSAFSTTLKNNSGTYTVTVVNPDDDIRVVGEITYVKDGTHTICADTKGEIAQ